MTLVNIISVHNKSKFDSDLAVKMCRDMMSIKIEYRKEESEKKRRALRYESETELFARNIFCHW